MLCAELETYFENLAAEILDGAQALWQQNKSVNHALACVIGACKEGPAIPSKIDEIKDDKPYLSELVRKACGVHRTMIQNNRGTKDFNILRMFIPVGITESDIDIELLAECNSITAQRGDVAHNTIDHAKILVDPRTEYDRYHKIIKSLRAFDALAEPLKSGVPIVVPAEPGGGI